MGVVYVGLELRDVIYMRIVRDLGLEGFLLRKNGEGLEVFRESGVFGFLFGIYTVGCLKMVIGWKRRVVVGKGGGGAGG